MLVDKTKQIAFNHKLDQEAIKTLKLIGVEMVTKAKSGHPGVVVSLATALHTLVTRHLIYDHKNPSWLNRDRVVFSGGHASALIYTYLNFLDLLTEEDLRAFRTFNAKTSGHPEYHLSSGIEVTTGPLGQGLANGVGFAIAETWLNYKTSGTIDHYVYIFCGDGDLQEGISWEAMSLAGANKLKKLICIYDSNDVQLDGPTQPIFGNESLKARCQAVGWKYFKAQNTIESIDEALNWAKNQEVPVMIEVKTILGEGLASEGSAKAHGTPPSLQEFEDFCQKLDSQPLDYRVPQHLKDYYQQLLNSRLVPRIEKPLADYKEFFEAKPYEFRDFFICSPTEAESTRSLSYYFSNFLTNSFELWIGGSADVASSTLIKGGHVNFSPKTLGGRNILFGVREAAMAAIGNGIALHSTLRPVVSTFLVFSDYLKPALRLSAFMGAPIVYIFSHDSVMVGQDGPTHQPIEHLAALRSIPKLQVFRPADWKEMQTAFEVALYNPTGPTVIVTSRQVLPVLDSTDTQKGLEGFYFLKDYKSKWSILSTGSELQLALKLGEELKFNVISCSNWAPDQQPLVNPQFSFAIEAASSFGWHKFAKYVFSIDSFGIGGPGEEVYKHFGFDLQNLKEKILEIVNPTTHNLTD